MLRSKNLNVLSTQKFKMYGFKFFDGSLKRIKAELEVTDPAPITSSAIALYIALHGQCDDNGLLPKDFKISTLAEKLNQSYSTVHTAFSELISRSMVREIFIGEAPYEVSVYEIANYAANNRTKRESSDNQYFKGFSYFRVPFEIFNTTVLSELVKHRDRNGLVLLLELFNGFTRELRKKKENLSDYTMIRTMKYLKERLGRNAKRVRRFMDDISPLFEVNTMESVREANPGRLTRLRSAVSQLWVSKFELKLAENCVRINDDTTGIRSFEAKMRKDAYDRIKHLGYALPKKDMNGIAAAFKDEVIAIAKWIEKPEIQSDLITFSMQEALSQLEEYITKTGKRVESVGGFVRTKLRQAWVFWRDRYLNDADRHDMEVSYMQTFGEAPAFLREA